jgi:hypothetical protein
MIAAGCPGPVVAAPIVACGVASLDTVATYLRGYMSEFRNSNFYDYLCDGDPYYIGDGGGDMFDDGNFTTPWLLSGTTYVSGDDVIGDYPAAVAYDTTSSTTTDTDFTYVSLGYIQAVLIDEETSTQDHTFLPLTVLGMRCNGPVGWQIGGNSGADGGGEMSGNILYAGVSINGFTVHAAYRQMYDNGDPVTCNLFILLGHTSWGSVFGPINFYADSDTETNGAYFYAGAGSQNVLAIQTLLSKPETDNDTPIPDSELQTIVGNFTLRIKESLGL